MPSSSDTLYGLTAEFETPEAIRAAALAMREAGYTKMEAYTPFPVDGLAEAVGFDKNRVPLVVLIGGLLGAATGYFMQWYANVIDYPLNVGGRPHHSWPSFIPITFELTILFASFAAFFGVLIMNRLPKPYQSVFNAPGFEHASQDRFILCVEADDPAFDPDDTEALLRQQEPLSVSVVEP